MTIQLYEVVPGPSSQTTSVIEEIVVPNSLSLRFFDVDALRIEVTNKNIWNDTARQILEAHTELWERLSKL